jgi:hypothetical protein
VKAPSQGRSALPLAAAAERLRRRPGRPKSVRDGESAEARQTRALPSTPARSAACEGAVPALCPISPRLLDLSTAAAYLGVSAWTVRDLETGGVLSRVRVPLPGGGELRKVLFDREDLDHLITRWKDSVPPRL